MTPALRTTGLTVDLGGRCVLDRVDLTVERGSWLTVAGANGAGKSTLLRAVAGVQVAGGTVELAGVAMRSLSRRARARAVAYVPQSPTVPPATAVSAYVLLGRTAHLSPLAGESAPDLAAVADALDQLDLRTLASRHLHTLSGGEQQRVVLARAIAQRAPLLLLDEPTSALDVGRQQDVLELVDELRRRLGLTVVATMHDLSLTAQYSDRVVLLDQGVVAASGTPGQVLTSGHLSALYDARIDVLRHRGALVIVPHRGTPATDGPPPPHPAPPTSQGAAPMSERTAADVPTDDPRPDDLRRAPSLVLVNTGHGKGKSSAAMGVMVRSVARGWDVAVIQFLKSGTWHTGEEKVARQLGVDWWAIGEGFTWDSEDLGRDEAVAASAWERARSVITAGAHQTVILDEITYPLNWGWISLEEVVATIRDRPPRVNIVCTGRNAPQGLVDVADTVTEMQVVKHAYQQRIRAKKGIDY